MICIKCDKEIPNGSLYCLYCGRKQVVERSKRTRASGTGTAYKRGNYWYAEATIGKKIVDGKPVYVKKKKGGFTRKKDALAYIPMLFDARIKTAPTLQELWDRFKDGPMLKLSGSQQSKYKYAWERWKCLAFTRVDQITTGDLQRVVSEKTKTYYPAKDMRDLMSNLYQLAMPDQFVSANLALYIDLPHLEAEEPVPWNEEEIKAFWSDYASGNTFTGYLLLMIYSGMMPGELLGARKDMIDWDNQQIVGGGKKTSVRKKKPIVIADYVVPVLASLCEYSRGEKLVTMNKDNFYKAYHETTARLGVRDLPPYSCRHTTATALALGNIAPSEIQEVMRHAKFSTTEKYIHIDTLRARQAVNKLAPASTSSGEETATN